MLPLVAGCAFGAPPNFDDANGPELVVEVVDATDRSEVDEVEQAATWWRACGRSVQVGGPKATRVRFVDDVAGACRIIGAVGCFGPDGVAIWQKLPTEIRRVVVAHEIGHLLGYGHQSGGLMGEPVTATSLETASCPP